MKIFEVKIIFKTWREIGACHSSDVARSKDLHTNGKCLLMAHFDALRGGPALCGHTSLDSRPNFKLKNDPFLIIYRRHLGIWILIKSRDILN